MFLVLGLIMQIMKLLKTDKNYLIDLAITSFTFNKKENKF